MNQSIKNVIDAFLNIKNMRQLEEKQRQLEENQRQLEEKQGGFPLGHYYSPIPDKKEVLAYIESRSSLPTELHGINLNKENQRIILNEYFQLYKDLPFSEKQQPECRYYYDNSWYGYGDAIFLYSFLRRTSPKKIIEVGSGFSSAVMLDTIDRYFLCRPEMTIIDPYPNHLKSLLRKGDEEHINLISKKVQDVSPMHYSSLESGDFLFIDSSHVVKCGSDLQFLFFDILPFLTPGIFVHFHDVFYPFDYPSEWLKEGRYWNENYFLRAFLSYNCEWHIYFFNNYVALSFNDFIKDKMPLCARSPGSSLYIQKQANNRLKLTAARRRS